MSEQISKVDGRGVNDGFVTEKKVEEKETGNKVTEKVVEETKEKPMIPTENVESDFHIISKETTKELASKNLDDEKKQLWQKAQQLRKKEQILKVRRRMLKKARASRRNKRLKTKHLRQWREKSPLWIFQLSGRLGRLTTPSRLIFRSPCLPCQA